MKVKKQKRIFCGKWAYSIIMSCLFIGLNVRVYSQKKIQIINANSEKVTVKDGANFTADWRLDPTIKPDIYYVNVPLKKSKVRFKTDVETLTFSTKPGKVYNFIILLNKKDSCHIQISSVYPPELPKQKNVKGTSFSIPFKLIDSKIYFNGRANGKDVKIQFDLGAGTSVVNRNVSEKLGLNFTSHKWVSNSQGINKERTSIGNKIKIGPADWDDVSLTEVGNMRKDEDLIIGNDFFRNKVIEINYDSGEFIVHEALPSKAKNYKKQPVFYEQNRPKFRAEFIHNNKKYKFWFLFDTGRDGAMLIGEDFTSGKNYWNELSALTTVNGRKIIRLDALIGGVRFKDIVTNAANPSSPNGRSSLFGNQILSHFNFILDNVNGMLYLIPNTRTHEPYYNYNSYLKEVSNKK